MLEDTSVWCENCKEWVEIEDYHETLEQEIIMLREQLEDLKEQLRLRDKHAQQRVVIEESHPTLSIGKPCPKCGQIVR